MNIYQKLNKVRKAVPYIKKDKEVQEKYNAVTHDQVTAHLHDVCVEQGIFVITSQVKGEATESGMTTSIGNPIMLYKATYEVSFVNMDDPADKFSINIEAFANDTGDKAPGKALSYAVKYAMLKVFMLETGENEESRMEGERKAQEKISEDQAKWIADRIVEYNIDQEGFNNFLRKNRCKNIKDINVVFFDEIERMINAKKPKEDDNA